MNLFLAERIAESIEILRSFEPEDGYYLAFSGGKDSVVLYEIATMAGVKFDAHYSVTSVDPPELVRFIKAHYPTVHFEHPGDTMWTLIPRKLMPPTRIVRYCCAKLKETGGQGRVVLTGVKRTDSHNRRVRGSVVRNCKKRGGAVISPLFHWNDSEIWEFIRSRGMPYCELYDQGFTRLGCVGCPMAGPSRQRMEFERWPKYKDAYLRSFGKMLNERKRKGLPTEWGSPEEVMEWWLNGAEANAKSEKEPKE